MRRALLVALAICAACSRGTSPSAASPAQGRAQQGKAQPPLWYARASENPHQLPDWACSPPIRRATRLRGASPPQVPKALGVFDEGEEDSETSSRASGQGEAAMEDSGGAAGGVAHDDDGPDLSRASRGSEDQSGQLGEGGGVEEHGWEDERQRARRERQALYKKYERAYIPNPYPIPLRSIEIVAREMVGIREQLVKEAQLDQWSQRIWDLADEYNVPKIEEMLALRRAELRLKPGRPLWVQLPLGGNNWVDAARLTTGTLIEAVLTCGQMLPRDERGWCIVPEDMPPMIAREEPLRSLLRHRLVMGMDDWGMSQEEDSGGDQRTYTQYLDDELGPYKEAHQRYLFGEGNYSLDDEEKMLELCEWRRQRKVDLAVGQNKTNEMLWKALSDSKFEDAEMLVRKGGAQLHALDHVGSGLNALQLCVSEGCERGVRLCVELGANLEARDFEGRTAFLVAAWYADVEMVRLLMELGADVHAVDERRRWTCFHYAAISEKQRELKDIFDLFLDASVDLRARDIAGRTARELARAFGYTTVEEYMAVLEDSGDAQATLIGCDWSKPEPGQLVPGGKMFVDSSDSNADKEHPLYPILSNVKKIKKAEPPNHPNIFQDMPEGDAVGYIDRRARRHRRYDGTDWADPLTPQDYDEMVDLVERAPTAFMKQEDIDELVRQGIGRWRNEQDDKDDEVSVDAEGLAEDYSIEVDSGPPVPGFESASGDVAP